MTIKRDLLFACWGIFGGLGPPIWGDETRMSLISLFSWWVPFLNFLFWIDQTQDHIRPLSISQHFLFLINRYVYIFIFSTNPCPNYLKSRGAWISLLLFFLLYREASYGHGPRGMMSGAPWFLPHPNHFLDFFIWMLLTASSIAFMWDIVSAFWSNLFIIS